MCIQCKSSGINVLETYLPPVAVCSREEEENLPFLHPDLLAILRDVLEVIVDHDKDLPVSLLHPDPHPDGVVEDTGECCQDMVAVMITPTLLVTLRCVTDCMTRNHFL